MGAPDRNRICDLRFRKNDIRRAWASRRTAELLVFLRAKSAAASLSIWRLPDCCPGWRWGNAQHSS